ncbi:pneumococcal serine-rich repeat protein isoform X1 [Drosophila sulfurigaster albostrigata]|uniref:pneumococcal serine-rich repeat protein isoform X1 n=1 Tax=Drosophila sulfurigaster albostrigata TaxID=89887 RepID=UPI002D21E53E|nr:pneumococcal serine-rich repeat protein isoform X1 [Drosophila sulfurigaster albostrigata]
MQASSTTTTTTTTKTKKLSSSGGSGSSGGSVAMTSASKTTTTTTTTTNRKPAGAAAKSPKAAPVAAISNDAHAEIAELSKKISEHADAIYQTWRSRGLPPAQLLEMYTNAAASGDFADVAVAAATAATTDISSAEGLQKMVTSFVNKDKEQRGKNVVKKASEVGVAAQSIGNGKLKKTATTTALTGATTTTTTPTTGSTKASKPSQQQASDQSLQSPKKVAAVTASKTLPDVNLNYDIDLHLDVNNLSQQQTQHLLKISELLQKEAAAAAAAAASATVASTGSTTPTKKRQSNSNGSKTSSNSNTLINSNNNNNKLTTATQNSKKLSKASSNNRSSSNSHANSSSESAGDAVDAPRVGVAVTLTDKGASEPTISSRKASKTKENHSEQQKPAMANSTATATATAAATTTSTTISTTKEKPAITRKTANSRNSSSNSNTDNSNASNIVANAKATATPSATSTAAAATTTATVGSSATSVDTTMPTLNKIKPTSGSRAALTNGQDKNLGRPILTRGSVAERVLLFEKRPDVRNSFLDIKRPVEAPPKSLLKVKLHATPPPAPAQEQNSLQKEIRSSKSVYIPRFYFPHGKPQPTIAMERVIRGILSAFDSFPNNQVTKDELPRILKLCGLPFYWRMPVMIFCQASTTGLVERQRFVEFWKQMNVYCHEAASRFVYILSRGQRFRSYIVPDDLVPLVQDVVDTHPGLAFLKEATEFHSRYVHTVIARIFYSVNRSWSGKITISELKRSDLLEMISLLEEEDDINQIMAFFSYEHFYVIYCKFWELDKDHDLLINQDDLAKHSDNALSTRIVERIFSGCVTRSDNKKSPEDEPKMSYTEFVWFILSEEDKRTPTAIEYWFRCMDIDGDGALSMYELEYFYEEQQQRMEGIGIECLPFEDCLCQMLDMIKPANRDSITLGDLKRCKMTHVFFDTFFNLEKYLDHEQRDPFAAQRDESNSDWDRFAAQEYELLISEEND